MINYGIWIIRRNIKSNKKIVKENPKYKFKIFDSRAKNTYKNTRELIDNEKNSREKRKFNKCY